MRNQPDNLGRFVLGMVFVVLLIVLCEECSGQVFADGFESEAGAPIVTCETPDPASKPLGFKPYIMDWQAVFYGHSYPSSGAALAPVGSFTLRHTDRPDGPSIAGRYISVPVTPGDANYRLQWLQAQPIYANGYYVARVARSVYITISPCWGDFRPPDNTSTDPYLRRACRKKSSAGALFYGSASGDSYCTTPNTLHYINFLFADPLDPESDTCAVGDECEVNVLHEQQG